MKHFALDHARHARVRLFGSLIAAALAFLSLSPPSAAADDLDLKKLFEESIPDAPFIAVVYKYADAMLQHGRDTYGPNKTGLFLAALDRKTLQPLAMYPPAPAGLPAAARPAAGQPLVFANPILDQNLLRLLYFLREMSTEERYAQAADAELTWLLGEAPARTSGAPPWSDGVAWNVVKDEFIAAAGDSPREVSRPWMLWDRCFAIDAEASSAFAAALRRRHSESRTGVELAANDLRQAGFLIRTFVDAFAHTGDKAYLEAIDALLVACEANRRADRRSAVPAPRPANCNAVYALSLAIDCDGAARKTPEPLRSRLAGFAAGIDASFCALPHDIREKQPFATEFGASADSPPHRTSLWNPADGRYTTAAVAVMCVSRYTNTGNIEFRELIVAAADAYLDALPADDVDAWPLAFSQAITLELAAFRITADGRYHARAFQLGQIAVEKFFGDSPLPRASLKSDHYEAATGGDSLALALAELHLSTRTITAVRTPANTLDR